jgi:hypothetical protein
MSDLAGYECWCVNVSLPPLTKLSVRNTTDPESYVDFAASGMPLVRLAELFDDLSGHQPRQGLNRAAA